MERVHVIVNPFSARGKTEDRWYFIKDLIKHYFKEFKFIFTEKPFQATEIVRELLKDGFDLIIGIGGDGTINEIANGFFSEKTEKIINNEASLGIIPSGTGSDFIRFLKIPRDFKRSVELIKSAEKKSVDIGKITYSSNEGRKRQKYFLNVADFGLGADVIKNLSDKPSSKRGPLSYYSGLLKTIRNFEAKNIDIKINGFGTVSGKFLIGAVANGGMFGGGMIIAPNATVDDGLFDLVLIEDMKKLEIVKNSIHLYRGTIEKNRKVRIIRTSSVEVSSPENVSFEYDGELGETLPAKFEIVKERITFRA